MGITLVKPLSFSSFLSISFFSLTALSVSSFHYQLCSPVSFLPVDLPHGSSTHFLIISAISSLHCSTFSVVASSMFDSLSTKFLRNFSFVSSSFSFHHLIRFRPAALLCHVFLTTRLAISTLRCPLTALYSFCIHLHALSST